MTKKIKLLRIHEAAEILGVHPETLRRWDRQGILNAIRVGARKDRRYATEDIQKKIRGKEIG